MTRTKEKTEEMLKEKEEALRLKEEELQTRGREQEKLQMEIKKLGKIKEFKPTMADLIAKQRARDDAVMALEDTELQNLVELGSTKRKGKAREAVKQVAEEVSKKKKKQI